MAPTGVDLRAHDIGTRIVLAQCYAAVQIVQGRSGVLAGEVHLRQADVGTVIAAIDRQQALKSLFGLVIILQGRLADGAVHEQVLVLGHEFEACVIVLDRAFKVTQILARNAPDLVGIDDKRIALNGHGRILLGAAIILQTDFRHRAVKIWLGQEWFGLDSLVKILNGQDVVLKIQGIATDVHHLVGIDLRLSDHGRQHSQQQRQASICRLYTLHFAL